GEQGVEVWQRRAERQPNGRVEPVQLSVVVELGEAVAHPLRARLPGGGGRVLTEGDAEGGCGQQIGGHYRPFRLHVLVGPWIGGPLAREPVVAELLPAPVADVTHRRCREQVRRNGALETETLLE